MEDAMERVITPDEAKRFTAQDEAEVGRIVSETNAGLQLHDWTQRTSHARAAKLMGKGKVRERVLQLLRQAGWKVEFRGDQRDGDYYEIE
jgi:hypothetical protein